MAKYVPDIKTQRWVIIAPSRTKRPADVPPGGTMAGKPDEAKRPNISTCPFCVGHEAETPSEVYRIGPGEPNSLGWQVRVVPNKFPITDIHEVIIHSPDDEKNFEDLPLEQVIKVILAYRDRYRAHQPDGQVLIFCNHGFHAGASLLHPHSQLVVIPKQINMDAVSREPVVNKLEEVDMFFSYCPDFSQWPFEIWIASNISNGTFGDITDKELEALASMLKRSLQRIKQIYVDPASTQIRGQTPFGYNFYIAPGTGWFVRIIPRFVHRAGFELGTGLNVNVVDPTDAVEMLRTVKVNS